MHYRASLNIVLLQLLQIALVIRGRCIRAMFAPCKSLMHGSSGTSLHTLLSASLALRIMLRHGTDVSLLRLLSACKLDIHKVAEQ